MIVAGATTVSVDAPSSGVAVVSVAVEDGGPLVIPSAATTEQERCDDENEHTRGHSHTQ